MIGAMRNILADTSDFKTGMAINMDGETYVIIDFQHVKPGKGAAFVRTKLKRVRNGAMVEKTFRAGEKVETVYLEKRKMQFLYKMEADQEVVLMDLESYEQFNVPIAQLGDGSQFLKEESEVIGLAVDEVVIIYELPNFVELKIIESEPGIKGDTVSGSSTKGAVVESGAKVQVPYHINEGDIIKIDTRTGDYIERINKR